MHPPNLEITKLPGGFLVQTLDPDCDGRVPTYLSVIFTDIGSVLDFALDYFSADFGSHFEEETVPEV